MRGTRYDWRIFTCPLHDGGPKGQLLSCSAAVLSGTRRGFPVVSDRTRLCLVAFWGHLRLHRFGHIYWVRQLSPGHVAAVVKGTSSHWSRRLEGGSAPRLYHVWEQHPCVSRFHSHVKTHADGSATINRLIYWMFGLEEIYLGYSFIPCVPSWYLSKDIKVNIANI